MTLYHEHCQFTHGATPHTFNGAQTVRFGASARRLVAIKVSASLSTYTYDEGAAPAMQLTSNNFKGTLYFPFGFIMNAGPATNTAVKGWHDTIVPLDIPIQPNTSMTINISTVIGATQTGTWDCEFEVIYDDGKTPRDIIDAIRFAPGSISPIALRGGQYNYISGNAAVTRAALTWNATAIANLPAEANELVGLSTGFALDTAVTESQETCGYLEHEFSGVPDAVDQKSTYGSGIPNLGTEVEGGAPYDWSFTPMYLKLPNTEVTTRSYINAKSAITGGADLAVFYLWR